MKLREAKPDLKTSSDVQKFAEKTAKKIVTTCKLNQLSKSMDKGVFENFKTELVDAITYEIENLK